MTVLELAKDCLDSIAQMNDFHMIDSTQKCMAEIAHREIDLFYKNGDADTIRVEIADIRDMISCMNSVRWHLEEMA